jgi:transcriptional regulator with XRE-family HTH domain
MVNMNLAQIGGEIHNKRVETGLLQEHVAKFAGLSRVTINQLENGTLKDLGYTKLKAVMDILGLDMETVQPSGLKSALTVAARSVSTSYRDVMTPEMLSLMLRSGEAPEQFQPHLMAFLDETPLPVVVKAVAEAATPDVPAKKIMKHLTLWAKQWKVCRTVW